jgi:hypothetical protein
MALTDIAQAMKVIRSEQVKRDREFKSLLNKGWKLVRLADYFHISRQRAQQIAVRLRHGKAKPRTP